MEDVLTVVKLTASVRLSVWSAKGEDLLFQTGSMLSTNQPHICMFLIFSMSRPDSLRLPSSNGLVLVSVGNVGGALLC